MFGLLRTLWTGLSRTRGCGYTLRGFWGQRKHYNKDGVQIGYSVKGFWGGWKRYDMEGNLISYTLRNFWGGYDTYDADGNLIRKSRRNFGGGFHTYDTTGKRVTESYRSFWGGVDHYEADAPAEVPKTVAEMPTKTNPTPENNVAKPTPQVAVPIQTEKVTAPPMPKPAEDKEDSFVHRDSQEYNDLLRSIDDMGAGTFEFREMSTEKDSVNILVFSYGKLKEFPAQAIFAEDTVRVVPLIKGVSGFTVPNQREKVAYLIEKGFSAAKLAEVIAKAQKERQAGKQVLVVRMNKNKKFQKDKLTAEGYTEIVEFFNN